MTTNKIGTFILVICIILGIGLFQSCDFESEEPILSVVNDLTASDTPENTIMLEWDHVMNAEWYQVYRTDDFDIYDNDIWTACDYIGTVNYDGDSTLTHEDDDIWPDITYYYYVEPYNSDYDGGVSNWAMAELNLSQLGTVTVDSQNITITLWDGGTIDDDTISIELNGSNVVSNLVLTDLPGDTYNLSLDNGNNTLTIYAEDEGTISPNTANIEVSDVISGDSIQYWSLYTGESADMTIIY